MVSFKNLIVSLLPFVVSYNVFVKYSTKYSIKKQKAEKELSELKHKYEPHLYELTHEDDKFEPCPKHILTEIPLFK